MNFLGTFLSYLLLLLVIVGLGAIALVIGVTMRKKKNAKAAIEEAKVEVNE